MYDSNRAQKMLWLHGPAGVGKSAIMQTVAQIEDNSPASTLGATVFFSRPNEHNDPKCLFTTIAYQLAVKYPLYRQYITDILTNDPQIVMKSISEQFKFFIVKAFVERDLFQGLRKAVSILLDGMDECKGEEAQRELILLIGRFTLQYPNIPLIWLIASRPEPRIRAAFSSSHIKDCHLDINVPVDSNQACADVERFLRDKFSEIRTRYSDFFPLGDQSWPLEADFLKVTNAASGHFLFAELIIRFIVDENYGNPVSQLQTVLAVIKSTPLSEFQPNPFTLLDNLYTQILANIPPDVIPTTKALLAWSFCCSWYQGEEMGWPLICNLLDLSQAAAYGALRKLHSVIRVPPPELMENNTKLQVFHASFTDYLRSSPRSGQYCTIITLKDTIPFLIKKLLESHDPCSSSLVFQHLRTTDCTCLVNSTVEPSRISVSWVYGKRNKTYVQRHIWRRTFSRIATLIGEVVPLLENTPEVLDRLAIFFRDIDFGSNFFVDDPRVPQWPFARPICGKVGGHLYVLTTHIDSGSKPKLFETLQDWGLVQTIGLQSIDLDCIRPGVVVGRRISTSADKSAWPPFLQNSVSVKILAPKWMVMTQ
jgi:hypothetical protein